MGGERGDGSEAGHYFAKCQSFSFIILLQCCINLAPSLIIGLHLPARVHVGNRSVLPALPCLLS